MSRPIYETAEDRDREQKIIEAVCKAFHPCSSHRLPRKYALDYFLQFGVDGSAMAWCEVKRRYNKREDYPTYMISLRKVLEGVGHSEATGHAFLIIVQWDDGIFVANIEDIKGLRVEMGGRADRFDSEDIEPVVHIPNDWFTHIAN